MTRRAWKGLAAGVLVVLVLIGLAWAIFGVDQVSMTQAALQARIDEKMPMKRTLGTVSNARLDLANNKINLSFDASTSLLAREYSAHATTTGTLRYDRLKGAFFFIPDELGLSNFRRVAGEEEKVKKTSALFELFKPAIQKAAVMAFEHIPVHTLKHDFKGIVIRTVLERVEVRDGTVIAHLTFVQLTKTVAILALVLIVLVAYIVYLVRHPEALAEHVVSELA